MKARRVIAAILSLAYLVFLMLCAYSPVTQLFRSGANTASNSTTAPLIAPSTPTPYTASQVLLSAGSFPVDTAELSVLLAAGETALLDQFTSLRRANFSGSPNYEEIAAWAQRHPEVAVTYTVTLPDGNRVDNHTTSFNAKGMTPEQLRPVLTALPEVTSLELGTVGSDISEEQVRALQESFPNVTLRYSFTFLGKTVSSDTDSLDLSTASAAEIEDAIAALPMLPYLKTIHLGAEGNAVTMDLLNAIAAAAPKAVLDYGFTYWGVPVNLKDSMLNLSHVPINDEGVSLMAILPLMRNCVGVDMDSCGVSNDALGYIQSLFPDVNIVWRIWFGTGYSVRTDVETILASSPSRGGNLDNEDVAVLKYCTKVKNLDLGHNADITDISFVSYMPDLEVFIIALSSVSDISPLANCPKLEYLELTYTNVSDLTPLSGLTELAHINLGDCPVTDLSPLFNLTKLERVWLGHKTAENISQDQIDHLLAQIAPNRKDPNDPSTPREYKYSAVYGVDTEASTPSEGSWKIVGYTDASLALFDETGWLQDVLSPRYARLRETFGYDNVPYCYSLAVNDPLY